MEEYHVVALDLPGFGAEPLINKDWGISEYAAWVTKKIGTLIDKQNQNVILLGHSFGGRIAAQIASEQQPWLKGLILYGAPVIYRPSTKTRALSKAAGIAKKLGLKSLLSGIQPNNELAQADQNGLGQIFRNVVSYDQSEVLPNIVVPVYLVWGENDQEAPTANTAEMLELIPSANLTVLPRLGHNAHLENATLFYGTIKNLIQNF
jgi:pimeloyl-ACP methyl ester carboxylesterase